MGNRCLECCQTPQATEATEGRSGAPSGVVTGARPAERTINHYQAIIDQTSSDFIYTKYRGRVDGINSSSAVENMDLIRSKIASAMISPNLASSPPSTGVVMMNCNDKSVGGSSSSSTSGGAAGVEGSELGGAGGDSSALGKLAREQAVLRILYARPSVELRLESTADEVASLIHQQTYGSIHGDGTAGTVVSFSPFEQPSEMRDERLRT